MEASYCNCKISRSLAPPIIPQTRNYSLNTKLPRTQENLRGYKLWQNGQRACGLVMSCAKSGGGSSTEMEAKIKWERDSDFGVEGKCEGKKGIVELMECLESEAIMGEDEGKEASDYNRRAKIFDKSAQVFQALKEETKESLRDGLIIDL